MSDSPLFRGRPIGNVSDISSTRQDTRDTPQRPLQRPYSDSKPKTVYLPQKSNAPPEMPGLPSLEISVFPINLIVAGTNSGDYINVVTKEISSTKTEGSMNYRQYLLQLIRPRGGDVVKLELEPENPFDSNAIMVKVELAGDWVCIGYIPASSKEAPGVSLMTNKDIIPLMKEKQLYTTGYVTHKEGVQTLGYRIVIKDHYL